MTEDAHVSIDTHAYARAHAHDSVCGQRYEGVQRKKGVEVEGVTTSFPRARHLWQAAMRGLSPAGRRAVDAAHTSWHAKQHTSYAVAMGTLLALSG